MLILTRGIEFTLLRIAVTRRPRSRIPE